MPSPFDAIQEAARQAILSHAARFSAGTLSPQQWGREMQLTLARNWQASYRAGLGRAPTKKEELWLRREYNKHDAFVKNFANDLRTGDLTEAQIANRASMYADRLRGLYEAGTGAAHELVLPFTPGSGSTQCFYDAYHVSVLTQEQGFINLPSVKPGMHVLSHKGRFCEVLEHVCLPGTGEGIEIQLSYNGRPGRTFIVTPDHLFATAGMEWRRADALQIGDGLPRIGKHCELPGCENVFDLFVGRDSKKRFCGPTCSNRHDIARRTQRAHEVTRQQAQDGNCAIQRWRRENPEAARRSNRQAGVVSNAKHPKTGKTYEELYGPEQAAKTKAKLAGNRKGKTLEQIFGEETAERIRTINQTRMIGGHAKKMRSSVKNPSAVKGQSYIARFGAERAEQIRHKLSEAVKKQWQDHGAEIEARLTAGKIRSSKGLPDGERTKPERIMADILRDLGITYKEQVWFLGRFCVDFFLPDHGMVLEADGDYWHNYPDGLTKDKERDALIKQKKGMDTFRFWERDLERDAKAVKEQIVRITANHAGLYQPIDDVVVTGVRQVYPKGNVECLVVADDHSFVVSDGLISHNCLTNCRCDLLYEMRDGKQVAIWHANLDKESCPDCIALNGLPHTVWARVVGR